MEHNCDVRTGERAEVLSRDEDFNHKCIKMLTQQARTNMGWMVALLDGRLDCWMDGWMDGCIVGWMVG